MRVVITDEHVHIRAVGCVWTQKCHLCCHTHLHTSVSRTWADSASGGCDFSFTFNRLKNYKARAQEKAAITDAPVFILFFWERTSPAKFRNKDLWSCSLLTWTPSASRSLQCLYSFHQCMPLSFSLDALSFLSSRVRRCVRTVRSALAPVA